MKKKVRHHLQTYGPTNIQELIDRYGRGVGGNYVFRALHDLDKQGLTSIHETTGASDKEHRKQLGKQRKKN